MRFEQARLRACFGRLPPKDISSDLIDVARAVWQREARTSNPTLSRLFHKPQEIPVDHPDSNNMFQPSPEKPFLATRGAIDTHTQEVIFACFEVLREKADRHAGLDYLQVFEAENCENLWFIEDGPGGAITALLPSEY